MQKGFLVNKWNMLLKALDNVYGHEGENNSTFKPINRYFDQSTGKMITIIQYTTKKQDEIVIKKQQPTPTQKSMEFLQNLLSQKKTKSK